MSATTSSSSNISPVLEENLLKKPSSNYDLDFPKNVTLGELTFDKRRLVVLDKNMKIADAARLLQQENFISAPVFDKEMKYFVGILDVVDIARWVALGCSLERAYKDKDFENFGFADGTVQDILNQSEKSKRIFIFDSNQSLESAMKILSFRDHRVIVCNSREWHHVLLPVVSPQTNKIEFKEIETSKSYSILTQSDVVQYIFQHRDKFSPPLFQQFSQQLDVLGLVDVTSGGASIVKAIKSERAIDGFLKMFDEGVSALAIVDKNGRLVANLSASDLRGLTEDKLKFLGLPISKYLKAVGSSKLRKPVTCSPKDSLNDLINKVVPSRIHRVWVTDSSEIPLGVVSLTDIITIAVGIYSDKKTA